MKPFESTEILVNFKYIFFSYTFCNLRKKNTLKTKKVSRLVICILIDRLSFVTSLYVVNNNKHKKTELYVNLTT